jgi:hypothetical protein
MTDDPRRLFIAAVGRLGRETQLHLDERHRHFRITNVVLAVMSILLIVLAIFNVYYIHILYKDMRGIVTNMESMHHRLKVVKTKMESITGRVGLIDGHMESMDRINQHTERLAVSMPKISAAMHSIGVEVGGIEQDMQLMSHGMQNVDQRLGHITGGVGIMRHNVREIARPMGAMNSLLP